MDKISSPLKELNGIIPSLHTPFKKNQSIDFNSLEKLIFHTIKNNCAGMLISAVAGETDSLDLEEKEKIMKFILNIVNDSIPIIVGCSSSNFEDIFKLVQIARENEAKWILVQAPSNMRESELIRFFKKVNRIGPSNLMIQDLSWNDYGLPDKSIVKLFKEIPSFKSLKVEVVNSGLKYSKIKELTDNKLHLTGGWAANGLIEAIKRGVHGFIPSTMEPIYNSIYKFMEIGEEQEARNLFYKILPAISFAHQHINTSIKFYKKLRVEEGLFLNDICRGDIPNFDEHQNREANYQIQNIITLQNKLLKK